MRLNAVIGAAVLALAGAITAHAGELKSGIAVGGRMPAYKATKYGGGDDGVELDKSLCYT